jgi:DNA-binding helix-hairpin-helix protein with protein kinase domain
VVIEKRQYFYQQKRFSRQLTQLERALKQLQKQKQLKLRQIQQKHGEEKVRLNRQEHSERINIEQHLQHKLSVLNHELNKLIVAENTALKQLQTRFNGQITQVNQQLHALAQEEQDAINALLPSLQQRFIADFLTTCYLNEAEIEGIGDKIKQRLALSGVHTAADIEHYRLRRIDGISERRAAVLQEWREQWVQTAKHHMPILPDQHALNGLRSQYERQRLNLIEQCEDLQAELTAQSAECKNLYAYQRRILEQESQQLHGETQRKLDEIVQRHIQAQLHSAQHFQHLSDEYHQLSQQQDAETQNVKQQLTQIQVQHQVMKQLLQPFKSITGIQYIRWILPRLLKKLAKFWA